jgi:hypothetical protein
VVVVVVVVAAAAAADDSSCELAQENSPVHGRYTTFRLFSPMSGIALLVRP